MSSKETLSSTSTPQWLKFVFGGSAATLSTVLIQPVDLIKTRMQTASQQAGVGTRRDAASTAASILRSKGISGFYDGLTAAVLRQMTYGTTRLGVYTWLFERFSVHDSPPHFTVKATLGAVAGAVAAVVGNPADISLVRMTSDGSKPANQRRDYRHALDAVRRIAREEGVRSLWRGTGPTVARAAVLNAAQLSSYSQAKELFLARGVSEGLPVHLAASVVAGLVTTVASLPVDIAKTRIQNMSYSEYSNALDVIFKVVKKEGFFK